MQVVSKALRLSILILFSASWINKIVGADHSLNSDQNEEFCEDRPIDPLMPNTNRWEPERSCKMKPKAVEPTYAVSQLESVNKPLATQVGYRPLDSGPGSVTEEPTSGKALYCNGVLTKTMHQPCFQ